MPRVCLTLFRLRSFALYVAAVALPTLTMAKSHLVYFGTYTRTSSRGIYAARLNAETGALSTPELVAETANPTWLVLSPDRRRLYATHPSAAQATGFTIDAASGNLTPLPGNALAREAAPGPSHLAVDATHRTLIAANYGEGFVASIAINPDGTLGAPTLIRHSGHGPNPLRQDKPHVHSATLSPDNRFVIVCDLGLDRIYTYAVDPGSARLTPASPPFAEALSCSGPRHFAFSPDGRHGYCLGEMGAVLTAFSYDAGGGTLRPLQHVSTLPAGYQANWASEVRVHPGGRFVYAANRGHDSIAAFSRNAETGELSLIEIVASGGRIPRNFALSPDGQWLICAHQDSGDVAVFRVHQGDGKLERIPGSSQVPMGVCVLFWN